MLHVPVPAVCSAAPSGQALYNTIKAAAISEVDVANPVTINVRLPEKLKIHGSQVLERNGISPSEIVRSVYRYMEKNQAIPSCLDVARPADDSLADKRRVLRRFVVDPCGDEGASQVEKRSDTSRA